MKLILADRRWRSSPRCGPTTPARSCAPRSCGTLSWSRRWCGCSSRSGTQSVPIMARPATTHDPRRQMLISLLMTGSTDNAIATQLGINVRSVRRWISELMDELGVTTRLQLGAALVRSDSLRSKPPKQEADETTSSKPTRLRSRVNQTNARDPEAEIAGVARRGEVPARLWSEALARPLHNRRRRPPGTQVSRPFARSGWLPDADRIARPLRARFHQSRRMVNCALQTSLTTPLGERRSERIAPESLYGALIGELLAIEAS